MEVEGWVFHLRRRGIVRVIQLVVRRDLIEIRDDGLRSWVLRHLFLGLWVERKTSRILSRSIDCLREQMSAEERSLKKEGEYRGHPGLRLNSLVAQHYFAA